MSALSHGDFTTLAETYSRYRPAYAPSVLTATLGFLGSPESLRVADVGAGTGIWTRMLAERGCATDAVEPNAAMRSRGENASTGTGIAWHEGSAERTGLESGAYDLVTMASALHWADFDRAVDEVCRVLRPGGGFLALWNTRLIEVNPLLLEIEARLGELVPELERVSSGRSEFCDGLWERLAATGRFRDVVYMEGRHVEEQTPQRYLGIWRSVNDVQVQAGPERFQRFLDYIERRLQDTEVVEATYLTRAWLAVGRR